MISTIHDDAVWRRVIPRILHQALPGHALRSFAFMPGGLINAMYRLEVEGLRDPLVLRLYTRDPSACQKEVDLHRLVAARVPVPEILYAATGEEEGVAPHALLRWAKGLTFRQLKARHNPLEIAEAAHSIGETLARIASFEFPSPGRIDAGLTIGPPLLEGPRATADFVENCLRSPETARRLDAAQQNRVRRYAWNWAPRMAPLLAQRRLVHSDFGGPNLLVDRVDGRWRVCAVIDWEFAFSGPPLVDVGHMMRYERHARPLVEPHFSQAFCAAGGSLPQDWRDLARAVDLMALCEILTRPGLPEDVGPELVELIAATTAERDAF
ncbi:MAG: aminoglycoside phosphotransferase family protein [Candidatus Solibacter sp.]|jgi:aminoglycoside phosphotransferase (APT) family kinase protein